MKFLKNAILIICLGTLPVIGKSQGLTSIQKGNLLVSPSITLGWYNYGYNLNVVNIVPPVGLNFEYAVNDLLSVGLEGVYGIRNYNGFSFLTGDNTYKYEYKSITLRGSFHYLDLLKNIIGDDLGPLNSEKVDFYIGFSTGMLITNYTTRWTTQADGLTHELKSFDSAWRFNYMAGFRYYFNDNLGAFLETGRNSLGWAKIGVTFKF